MVHIRVTLSVHKDRCSDFNQYLVNEKKAGFLIPCFLKFMSLGRGQGQGESRHPDPTPQGRCRDASRMQGDAKGRKGMQADARRCKPMLSLIHI